MDYLTLKALHVVGFISWFAGLFYVVRLFIYHAEAGLKPEAERAILQPQYELMQWRLWRIITTPAMLLTLACGIGMVVQLDPIPKWLHWKFGLLAGLLVYHHLCGRILKAQAAGTSTWKPTTLRVFNEVATMFMVAIVFLAVKKTSISALWGVVGLVLLGMSLMLGIKAYKRILGRSQDATPTSTPTEPAQQPGEGARA